MLKERAKDFIYYGFIATGLIAGVNFLQTHPDSFQVEMENRLIFVSLYAVLDALDAFSTNELIRKGSRERVFVIKGLSERPSYAEMLKPFPLGITAVSMFASGVSPVFGIPICVGKIGAVISNFVQGVL